MVNAFAQGQAAMYCDSTVIGIFLDPSKSVVYDKLGFALHPKQRYRLSETGGHAIGIPANAKNREAAFLFLQYITTKKADKELVKVGGTPHRMSTVHDPELRKMFPYFEVLAEQLKYANPDWRPIIPEWPEVETNYLGIAVSEALTGAKAIKKALDEIVPDVTEIMEEAGYYIWQ